MAQGHCRTSPKVGLVAENHWAFWTVWKIYYRMLRRAGQFETNRTFTYGYQPKKGVAHALLLQLALGFRLHQGGDSYSGFCMISNMRACVVHMLVHYEWFVRRLAGEMLPFSEKEWSYLVFN